MSALLQKKKICLLRGSIGSNLTVRSGKISFSHPPSSPYILTCRYVYWGEDGEWGYLISSYLFATVMNVRIVCVHQCINVRFPLPPKKLWVYLLNYLFATVIHFLWLH